MSVSTVSRDAYSASDVAVAYISLVVPDVLEYRNCAVHNNGNTYMREILLGLCQGGFASVTAISARPMPSFPKSRELLVRRRTDLVSGELVHFVPYLNITPFKQIGIGIGVAMSLFVWAWRNRRTRQKVVFAFNLSVPPITLIALAARLTGSRLFAYVCDVNVPGQTVPCNLRFWFDAWLQRFMLKKVYGLAVITDRIAEDFAPGKPYFRLDGGLPREVIKEYFGLNSNRRNDNTFVIAATGNLCKFNGIPQILEAFSMLTGDHYRLRIAGRGSEEELVREAADRDSRIEYCGFLAYPKLIQLHEEVNVLISMRITSSIDTHYAFPSKTMEYLSSGVPVITTPTGHMRDEYGQLCILLKDESAKGLADSIREVESMPASRRRELGQLARSYMLKHKTWPAQTSKLVGYIMTRLNEHE